MDASSICSYAAIFITLAAFITYINHRFIKMNPTIAIMAGGLLISIFLLIFSAFGFTVEHEEIAAFIEKADFSSWVMNVLLGLLLFAGALTIDLTYLKEQKIEVAALTVFSTIASAFVVAFFTYGMLHWIGIDLPFVFCFLFGSLISPTDPIAVLATFKKLQAPKKIETIVSAESLFNDGVGVVLFITAYELAFKHVHATPLAVMGLFVRSASGGVLYGLIVGWCLYALLREIKEVKVEILVSLGWVFGSYTLARLMGISGPLAMVVAGIFLANYKRKEAFPIKTREELNFFWEVVEEILNAILFLVLGFELLVVEWHVSLVIAAISMIPLVLLARFITVALPFKLIKRWRETTPYTVTILTWGGLRGGLAVALALTIPIGEVRNELLTLTYAVVMFSILIQGTTINPILARMQVEQ